MTLEGKLVEQSAIDVSVRGGISFQEVAASLDMPLPLMSAVNQLQEMGRAQGLTRLNTPAAMGRLYEILTAQDLSGAALEAEKRFPQSQEPEVIYLKK